MKRVLILSSFVLLAGCSTVNAAAKARTDALIAETRGSHNEAAPSSWTLPEWKPGSWIAYKSLNDGAPSFTKMSVLSTDAEGTWIENESWTHQNHTLQKILYSRMPRNSAEAGSVVRKMVVKTDDNPAETIDFEANPMIRNMMSSMMGGTLSATTPTDPAAAAKENVTVAAGTFAGAAKDTVTLQYGPVTKVVTTWFHPAVPIMGMVKNVAADGSFSQELLDYGWSGARSALP